jgi:acyl carrier protein
MEARQRIKQYIAANYLFSDDPDTVGDQQQLIQSGVLDSMGIFELITFIEGGFGIKVTPEEMLPVNFGTVEAIDAFVRAKQAA